MHTKATIPDDEIWNDARRVAKKLIEQGYEAFFVGGCVRDLLLKRKVNDIDIATNATPEQVEKTFPKTLSVGKSFGVIIVIGETGRCVEVATFRNDSVYVDGRRPSSIEFATAHEDVQRRDFTINALLLHPQNGNIIDHVDGLRDLENRILRVVGDCKRLAEDRLRVLRGCRFAAHLGLAIEEKTWGVIVETSLTGLSRERIWQEVFKALQHSGRKIWWQLIDKANKKKEIFPIQFTNEVFIGDCLAEVGEEEDLIVPLALILLEVDEKELNIFLKNEPLAKKIIYRIAEIRKCIEIFKTTKNNFEQRKIARNKEAETIQRILDCRKEGHSFAQKLREEKKIGEIPTLLNATDLIRLGIRPGKHLGKLLHELETAQLDNQISTTDEALLWLNKLVKEDKNLNSAKS